MKRIPLAIALAMLYPCAMVAEDAAPPVILDDLTELLKLPRKTIPIMVLAEPFIRFSPDGKRYVRLRMYGSKAKVHLGRLEPGHTEEPVPWDHPVSPVLCRMGLLGRVWRADGQRVLFVQPKTDDDGRPVAHAERTLSPWAMCRDLPNPQCKRCRHMGVKGAAGCTALSFSPDGKLLWTAFSDLENFKVCGVTVWDRAAKRGREVYRKAGAAVHYLVPSPDGRHLAWVETHRRKARQPYRGPEVVVFDIQTRKVVERIELSNRIPGWLDAQPPVWTADSRAICYGDVVSLDRVHRREVRLRKLGDKRGKLLVRDALAMGAAREGIVLNRGPHCQPMAQMISSIAPPGRGDRPVSDDVILCSPAGDAKPITLVPNAFAQDVVGDRVYYAFVNGDHMIVSRGRLKRTRRGKGGR